MSLVKQIFFGTTAALPFGWLNRVNRIPVLFPYHHLVSDNYLPHIKGLYDYKNIKQFTDDLEWLLKHRKPVHPHELALCIQEKKPFPEKTFLLTFDDGLREVYDIIAPILLSKGVPAIFFINPGFIDNRELFYRCKLSLVIEKLKEEKEDKIRQVESFLSIKNTSHKKLREEILKINYRDRHKSDILGGMLGISFDDYLNTHQPFMRRNQLLKLLEKGFVIGAHSMDHPHYGVLTEEEQLEQTISSLKYVKELTGAEFDFFSFPHEDKPVKQSFFTKLNLAISNPRLMLFGTQNQLRESNNHMVHRFNAENPKRPVDQMVKTILFYDSVLAIVNKNIIRRD